MDHCYAQEQTVNLLADDPPLRQTFARVAALSSYIQAHLGAQPGEEWTTPETFFAPNSALLDTLPEAAQQRFRTTTANVVGSALFQNYQWPLIGAAIATYLADRRVPDLSVGNVQISMSEAGDVQGIAFKSGRFHALPDDPAAYHPDATIVASQVALREHLRLGLEAHLELVIEQLCQVVGCRPKGLWLAAADRCASTISWLMQIQDSQTSVDAIRAEVDGLISAPGSRFVSPKVSVFTLSHGEQTQIFCDRATCCYWYKTDGGGYCSTCPRLSQAERSERLLQYLVSQHEQAAS
jgi:hypothetical protein